MKRFQGRRQLARGNILPFNFAPFVRFDIYRRAVCSMYEVEIRKESRYGDSGKILQAWKIANWIIERFKILEFLSKKKVKIQICLNIGNTNWERLEDDIEFEIVMRSRLKTLDIIQDFRIFPRIVRQNSNLNVGNTNKKRIEMKKILQGFKSNRIRNCSLRKNNLPGCVLRGNSEPRVRLPLFRESA